MQQTHFGMHVKVKVNWRNARVHIFTF